MMNKKPKYVLLWCWYEGDGWLVDDSFVAVGESIAELAMLAKSKYPGESVEVYGPGEKVPDNGHCFDTHKRFRIAKLAPSELAGGCLVEVTA